MKLFIKGLLLYTAIVLTILLLCSIDSIFNDSMITLLLLIDIFLILLCTRFISYRELSKLSLDDWFTKHMM
jgi:hypothetical protein